MHNGNVDEMKYLQRILYFTDNLHILAATFVLENIDFHVKKKELWVNRGLLVVYLSRQYNGK